jgi:hypothetical protein
LPWPSIQRLGISMLFFSINSDQFHSYVDSIYPSKLEIRNTTELSASASYLDVLLNIDSGSKLTTQLYGKRIDFDVAIVNFT